MSRCANAKLFFLKLYTRDGWLGYFFLEKLDKVSYFYSLFFSFLLVCAWMIIFCNLSIVFYNFLCIWLAENKVPLEKSCHLLVFTGAKVFESSIEYCVASSTSKTLITYYIYFYISSIAKWCFVCIQLSLPLYIWYSNELYMGGINHRLFDIYPLRRRNRTKKKFYAFIIIYHLLIYVYFDTVVYICKKIK